VDTLIYYIDGLRKIDKTVYVQDLKDYKVVEKYLPEELDAPLDENGDLEPTNLTIEDAAKDICATTKRISESEESASLILRGLLPAQMSIFGLVKDEQKVLKDIDLKDWSPRVRVSYTPDIIGLREGSIEIHNEFDRIFHSEEPKLIRFANFDIR